MEEVCVVVDCVVIVVDRGRFHAVLFDVACEHGHEVNNQTVDMKISYDDAERGFKSASVKL